MKHRACTFPLYILANECGVLITPLQSPYHFFLQHFVSYFVVQHRWSATLTQRGSRAFSAIGFRERRCFFFLSVPASKLKSLNRRDVVNLFYTSYVREKQKISARFRFVASSHSTSKPFILYKLFR